MTLGFSWALNGSLWMFAALRRLSLGGICCRGALGVFTGAVPDLRRIQTACSRTSTHPWIPQSDCGTMQKIFDFGWHRLEKRPHNPWTSLVEVESGTEPQEPTNNRRKPSKEAEELEHCIGLRCEDLRGFGLFGSRFWVSGWVCAQALWFQAVDFSILGSRV